MSETRRRRRPLPPEIPSQFLRVYCPACSEVQWGYGRERNLYGTTVRSHTRWEPGGEKTAALLPGEPLRPVLCRGGKVDLVKDRAP